MPLPDMPSRADFSKVRLTGIEAARGFAALFVVLFHATAIMSLPKYFAAVPLGGVFSFGYAGVDFFFVLSGFIILFVHYGDIGKQETLKAYTIKRVLRIYPVYWIVSALVLLALWLDPSLNNGLPSTDSILRSFLLVPQEGTYPLVIVAWTLVHEVFFYLMFGILIFRPCFGLPLMAAWFFGVLLTVAAEIKWGYFLAFVFNLHNIEFFLGMMVAFLCLSGRRLPYPIMSAVGGVALFCMTGMVNVYFNQMHTSVFLIVYAISSALIVFGLVSAELNGRILMPKWSQFLGASSYSLYLIHFMVLSFIMKLEMALGIGLWLPLWISWCVSVALTVSAGLFFYFFVERKLLGALRLKVLPKKQLVAAV